MSQILQAILPVAPDAFGRSVPGIYLRLQSDGTIGVLREQGRTTLYEQKDDGVQAVFDDEGFSLLGPGETVYEQLQYDNQYAYKDMPVFKAWLVQQSLQQPK